MLIASVPALVSISYLVYGGQRHDFFALDDFIWLHAVRTPSDLNVIKNALTFPKDSDFFVHTPFWRPAIDAYFWVMGEGFAFRPEPYHTVNIVLHGLNAVLVAWICRLFTRSLASALLAGALFAVLPTYEFAVSWISEATDLFGLFFYLLAVLFYGLNLRRRTTGLYGLALFAYVAALLCKESSVTLPALLVGLEIALHQPGVAWRESLARLLPVAVVSALYGALVYFGEYRSTSHLGLYSFGPHALGNIWTYVKWMAWPSTSDSFVVSAGRVIVMSTVVGALALAAWRRNLAVLVAFGWMVLALLPVSFFAPASSTATPTAPAQRSPCSAASRRRCSSAWSK